MWTSKLQTFKTPRLLLTLPSNSSLQEFSNNANNSFKVRLPRPLRLEAGNWKVALASISMPDPKNTLPIWLDENTPLIYTLWYHIKKQDLSDRTEFQASFLLKDINTHVDRKMMTGHDFMKAAVDYLSSRNNYQGLSHQFHSGRNGCDHRHDQKWNCTILGVATTPPSDG